MTKPVLAKQTENGRMYVHPVTGEAVYSVTTIIDSGIPKDLAEWGAKQAAHWVIENRPYLEGYTDEALFDLMVNAHKKTRDEAADKGDVVHESAEGFTQGTDDGKSPQHMVQLNRFLNVSGFRMVHREVTLWNGNEGYAGTADWIAVDRNGRYVLGDYKTGKYIWPEMAVQLEALARCEVMVSPTGEETPVPPIHTVGVVHLRPKSWWWHPIQDPEARQRNWEVFQTAVYLHEEMEPVRKWKSFHPNLVWGTLGRFNEANWPQVKAT